MTRFGPRSGAERILALAYGAGVVAFAVAVSIWTLENHYVLPHFDDWRILDGMFSTPLFKWLFTDAGGHLLPVPRLLMFLDLYWLNGDMLLPVVASLLCAWLAALFLWVGFRAGGEHISPLSRTLFGFLLFCLFWSGSYFDFIWGTNQGSQLCRMWLFFAVGILLLEYDRRQRGLPARTYAPLLAGTACVFATFSQPLGAASWVAVGLIALVGRFRPAIFAGLFVSGLATVALYSHQISQPVSNFWRLHPLRVLEFCATFVGAPVAHVASGLGWIGLSDFPVTGFWAGIAALAGLTFYLLHLWRSERPIAARDLLALGLMAFTVGGGILVGMNRAAWQDQAVSGRYETWTIVFWMGAACALSSRIGRRGQEHWLGMALVWVLSLAMLPSLQVALRQQVSLADTDLLRVTMLRSGVQWDGLARVDLGSADEVAYRVAARLRQQQLGFFSDGRGDLLGAQLRTHFEDTTTQAHCRGRIQLVRGINAREPAAMVFGRAQDATTDRPPSYLILADTAGVIHGLGEVALVARKEHGPDTPSDRSFGMPWFGFIAGFRPAQNYFTYAVLDDGRTICKVGDTKVHAPIPSPRTTSSRAQ